MILHVFHNGTHERMKRAGAHTVLKDKKQAGEQMLVLLLVVEIGAAVDLVKRRKKKERVAMQGMLNKQRKRGSAIGGKVEADIVGVLHRLTTDTHSTRGH